MLEDLQKEEEEEKKLKKQKQRQMEYQLEKEGGLKKDNMTMEEMRHHYDIDKTAAGKLRDVCK